MISIHHVGRALISFGIILLLSGIVIYFADVLNLGKLPGDIIYKNGRFTLYFPWVTLLVISVVVNTILRFIPFKK